MTAPEHKKLFRTRVSVREASDTAFFVVLKIKHLDGTLKEEHITGPFNKEDAIKRATEVQDAIYRVGGKTMGGSS
jgi:hypothetical protein